jgi:SAM-dependent methyltransferase
VNVLHRWYCASARWRRTVDRALLPWVLGRTALDGETLEIGPGPGATTEGLLARGARVTALEIDEALAESLRRRLAGRATVRQGTATDASFDVVASFTMLHHLPSAAAQQQALAECRRVLRPGGVLVGCDSRPGLGFRLAHLGDTMVVVDPRTLAGRLEGLGFVDARVETATRAFRFTAVVPS